MAKIIKIGAPDTLSVTNKRVKGFLISLYGIASTVNTDTALGDSKPENVVLGCYLTRGGKKTKIFSDRLRSWNAGSNFLDSDFELNKVGATTGQIVLREKGVATKEIALWPYKVMLPSVVHMMGSDVLELEIQINEDAVGDNLDAQASQYYVTELTTVDGHEFETPVIDVFYIPEEVGEWSKKLGNKVSVIRFLNFDKSSQLLTSKILESFSLGSDKGKIQQNYIQTLTENVNKFTTLTEAEERAQSLELYNGGPLDNVELDLVLNPDNVNPSKCIIYVERAVTNAHLIERAEGVRVMENAEVLVKHGVGDVKHATKVLSQATAQVQKSHSKLTRRMKR
jgi:hypothetical protein